LLTNVIGNRGLQDMLHLRLSWPKERRSFPFQLLSTLLAALVATFIIISRYGASGKDVLEKQKPDKTN
jgi:hypothetical protein